MERIASFNQNGSVMIGLFLVVLVLGLLFSSYYFSGPTYESAEGGSGRGEGNIFEIKDQAESDIGDINREIKKRNLIEENGSSQPGAASTSEAENKQL